MGGLLRDLRFAARMLAKSPGFTLIAVITMALGIGANTAIFSTVNTILLKPLPYRDPDRLVVMWETSPAFAEMSVSYANYLDYRKRSKAFTDLAAFRSRNYNLTGTGGEAERVNARMITAGMLPLLGVQPQLGRNFLVEEDAPNGARSVILAHGFWQRRYGGDPSILGKPITLDGQAWTVVGVMGADFRLFGSRDIYVPIGTMADNPGFQQRGNHPGIFVIGRMKPGITIAQARADLAAVGTSLETEFPKDYGIQRPAINDLHDEMTEDVRGPALILLGAVLFVLLIAATNVANLLLARALTRQKEMGVRTALGSGRFRLIRQLLVESALIALLGGGLGLLVALWGVDLLAAAKPDAIEAFGKFSLDRDVLLYTLGVSLITGILFGLAPALIASRQDISQAIKEGDHRTTAGGRRVKLRSLLVVAEVALAVMLLVGAGLSLRGFWRLADKDPGYRADNVLTMRVSLPGGKYDTAGEVVTFWSELRRRVSELPGVVSVAASNGLPLGGAPETSFYALDEDANDRSSSNNKMTVMYTSTSGFLETLGIQLHAGRTFTKEDEIVGAPGLAVVDENFARTLFPDGNAINKQFKFGDPEVPPVTIVGVVGHVAHYGLEGEEPARNQLYLLWARANERRIIGNGSSQFLVIRTAGAPANLTQQVRAQVAALDPEQPVFGVTTMEEMLGRALAERRFMAQLLAVFAGLALLLSAVGLYAVMADLVHQRTHEIGVRMALGAQARDVVALVVKQGARLVGLGVIVGAAGAFAMSRLGPLAKNLGAADPWIFLMVVAGLVAASVVAAYIPARRATRVDPMVVLRHE
jgi:putative ABC transport system permease protein